MEISQIHSKWSQVNLPSLQKLLDTQSLEIFSTQQSSLASRKRLANLTRDFKKQVDPGLNEFKALLKEYQTEIDQIHKRAKTCETWFIDVYKILVELPDPLGCIEKLTSMEKEQDDSKALVVENDELQKVVNDLQNQIVLLKKQAEESEELREKLKDFQSMLDNMVTEKAQAMVQEMKIGMEERIQSHKETEYALTRQINNLKEQFVALKSSQDFNTATSSSDIPEIGNMAEVEVLMAEIEKCNEKISLLSNENFGLREEIKRLGDESQSEKLINEFEAERVELHTTIEKMKKSLEESQTSTNTLIDGHKSQIQSLDRQIAKLNTEIARMSTLLLEYSDYEEVKKELEIFKNMDGDFDGTAANVPLERIVLEKNKKLENENTSLKNECEVLNDELSAAKSKIDTITETLQSKTNLISKLEKDIQKLNDLRASTSPSENLEMLMSPVKSTDSIVPILTSQRDRYRQRFEQSQRTIQELSTKLTATQDQLSRLQQDNVSLYEKLRYQESYRGTTAVTMGDDVSTRYRDKYESTIDPFRQFKQEENRRASNLSPTDRLAMHVTKILTANKYTRLVFVLYAGLLHILVFVALFEMMGSSTSSTHLPFPNKPDS